MRRGIVGCIVVLALAGAGAAQEPAPSAAPVLTSGDLAQLERFELKLENAALKIELLKVQAKATEAEAQAFIASLAREGYRLDRGQDGTWRYVPNE